MALISGGGFLKSSEKRFKHVSCKNFYIRIFTNVTDRGVKVLHKMGFHEWIRPAPSAKKRV